MGQWFVHGLNTATLRQITSPDSECSWNRQITNQPTLECPNNTYPPNPMTKPRNQTMIDVDQQVGKNLLAYCITAEHVASKAPTDKSI